MMKQINGTGYGGYLALVGILSLGLFLGACQEAEPSAVEAPPVRNTMDSLIEREIARTNDLSRRAGTRRGAIEQHLLLLRHPDFGEANLDSRGQAYHKAAVYFYRAGDYETAIPYFDTAVSLREQMPLSATPDLANSIYLWGVSFSKLDRCDEALIHLERIIGLAEAYPERISVKKQSQFYAHAALCAGKMEDFGKAFPFFERAQQLTAEAYGEASRQMAGVYNSMGNTYSLQGDTAQTFAHYHRALLIYQNMTQDGNTLMAQGNVASVQIEFGQVAEARQVLIDIDRYLTEHRDEFKDLSYFRFGYNNDINRAFAEIQLGNLEEAQRYYQRALERAQRLHPSERNLDYARAYEGLGDVATARRDYPTALRHYQRATESLCFDYRASDPLDLPQLDRHLVIDRKALKRILSLKAEALQRAHRAKPGSDYLEAAFQTYRFLDALIVQIQSGFKSQLSRFDLIEGTLPIYENATKVALQSYERSGQGRYLEAGLNFASKNKATVLLQDLRGAQALSLGIPSQLLFAERQLKRQFYDLETTIFDWEEQGRPSSEIDSAKQVRFAINRERERLVTQFEVDYPAYHALRYRNVEDLQAQKLRASLPPQTALLEFFVGNDSIYTFCLTAKELRAYHQPKPQDFDALCQSFRRASTERVPLAEFVPLARRLYQMLFAEPLGELDRKALQRLFLVPDDRLFNLSLDALLYEDPTPEQLRDEWAAAELPYLIRRYAVQYAYSNRLLYADQSLRVAKASLGFAGFGLDYQHYQAVPNAYLAERRLGPLPNAVEEVKGIHSLLGGRVWLNRQATRATFIEEAPRYRLLHLAAHGMVDKKFPLRSALVFSPNADGQDSMLAAKDVLPLALRAELAVLSACDTGTGSLQKGEGMMSLARAFNYAGCPSLVASLWKANDAATKDLMLGFYQYLLAGVPKDVALQKAKLDYLEQHQRTFVWPQTWTHLVQIGDPRALKLR
ncbi:MAG: CHAT domain-containing tetratricopeptide repeat protein [Bacteroidota bacterium]